MRQERVTDTCERGAAPHTELELVEADVPATYAFRSTHNAEITIVL